MTARGLLLASHPVPALTVTALAVALVLAVGAGPATVAGTALAVLAGQLSVGWSNDAADAPSDWAAGRNDKPVVRGLVSARTVWVAALVALAVATLSSLLLMGLVPGGLHLVAVALAWAYNLWAKDTPLSPLPYAVAFALLPVVVAGLAEPPVEAPAWWVAVCACVGVAGHLANTAPDIDSDRSVGRGGLAVVLGSGATRVLAVGLVTVAVCVLLLSVADASPVLMAWALACLPVLVVSATVRDGRWLFPAVMVVAVTNAGLLWALA